MSDQPDETKRDPEMMHLAEMVMTFDSDRVGVMIDLLRTTVINSRAPQVEVLWALTCVAVAIVRADKSTRLDLLGVLQRMIALSMGLAETRENKDRDGPPPLH